MPARFFRVVNVFYKSGLTSLFVFDDLQRQAAKDFERQMLTTAGVVSIKAWDMEY